MGIKKNTDAQDQLFEVSREWKRQETIQRTIMPMSCELKKKMTRRDFIASGALMSTTGILTPSIFQFAANHIAYGQDCPPSGISPEAAKQPAMMEIVLRGGANCPVKNFAAGGAGGQNNQNLTPIGYQEGGHASDNPYVIDFTLGLGFSNNSPLLFGIRQGLSGLQNPTSTTPIVQEIAQYANGEIRLGFSNNDNSNNPNKAAGHFDKFWKAAVGKPPEFAHIVREGGEANAAYAPGTPDANSTLLVVNNPGDTSALNQISVMADRGFSPASINRILAGTASMSNAAVQKFTQKALIQQVKDLVKCEYLGFKNVLNNPSNGTLDALADPDVQVAYNKPNITYAINNQAVTLNNGEIAKRAACANMVVKKYATVMECTNGGYDYHGNGEATATALDRAAGIEIGLFIHLCYLKGVNCIVSIITDGGIIGARQPGGVNGTPYTDPANDRSAGGASALLAFNFASGGERPKTIARNGGNQLRGAQLGAMTPQNGVDPNFDPLISNNGDQQYHGSAALLTLCALQNRMDLYAALTAGKTAVPVSGYVNFAPFKSGI